MRLASVLTLFSIGISALTMSGCGYLWKKKSGSTGPEGEFSLSGEEQRHFEEWKQALVKDCTTDHAFEKKAPEADRRAIDLAVFFQRTGNSLVMKPDGGFVLFGYPQSLSGTSVSRLERSASVGGATDSFGAKMTREGARCVVEINGEIVHEAYLFSSVPVLAHSADAAAQLPVTRRAVRQTEEGLLAHGLIAAWEESRVRPEALTALLKPAFADWSDEDIARFFPADDVSGLPHAVSFEGDSEVPLISGEYPQIPASVPGWQDYGDHLGDLTYSVLIPVQKIKFGSAENSADQGVWRIEVQVGWKSAADSASEYQVKHVSWLEPVADDAERAAACLVKRHSLFSGTGILGSGAFAPSFAGVSGPCSALTGDFPAAMYASGEVRSLVANKFNGRSGGGNRDQYLGWDTALEDFALAALAAGEDLKTKLDPGGTSPLIAQLAHYTRLIDGQAAKYETTKENIRLYVGTIAFAWAFKGLSVADEEAGRIMQAVAHVTDPFAQAAASWLSDLAKDPAGQKDQIAWALAVTEDIKAEVRSLQAKAEEFAMRGVFDAVKLGRVIQDRTDIGPALATWRTALMALSSFRNRDEARVTDIAGLSFDSKFDDLAQVAITEDWTDTEFTRAEQISAFARKRVMCENYADTTSLIACVGDDLFSKQPGAFFAPDFGDRYAVLAGEFAAMHGRLGDSDHVFVGQKLEREFWTPVWKSCGDAEFQANRTRLGSLVDQLIKADTMDRFDIERDIRDLLDQCD